MGLTMLFYPDAHRVEAKDIVPEVWQIRLMGAEAVELDEEQLKMLWQQEPLFAKIRSHICECGKPSNTEELEKLLQEQLAIMEEEKREPEQTKT